MKREKINIVIHTPIDIQAFETKHMKESTSLLLSIIKKQNEKLRGLNT